MSILIMLLLITVLPFLCGMIPTSLQRKENQSLLTVYVYGWFFIFASFQTLAIPFILFKKSFSSLAFYFTIFIFLFALISTVVGIRKILRYRMEQKNLIDKKNRWEITAWIIFLVLLAVQIVFFIFNQYIDGDDAFYVAEAMDAWKGDVMYMKNAYDGYSSTELDIRHGLAPVPIFMAWMAKLTGIHPTVIAHSIIGPFFLVLMYAIYSLVGKRLLRDKSRWLCLFMLFVMVFYIFGHVSLFTAETFAYTRTWQGKSMLPNLMIPGLYLTLLKVSDEAAGFGEWFMLFIVTIAATMTTSVAIIFVAIVLALGAFWIYWRLRRKSVFFKMAACILPCVLLAVIYVLN